MTKDCDRPPFDAALVKRTPRLVARKSAESITTIFPHSPSPSRISTGRSSASLKGSITLSGSLRVRSPRTKRPTILPPKQEAATQTSDDEANAVRVDPGCKLHTKIRYGVEELRNIQPGAYPTTSLTKTVRFAADTSEIKRDPAIIYCAMKQTKEQVVSFLN